MNNDEYEYVMINLNEITQTPAFRTDDTFIQHLSLK